MFNKLRDIAYSITAEKPVMEKAPPGYFDNLKAQAFSRTPDRAELAKKATHLLFVYDDMKSRFPHHYMIERGSQLVLQHTWTRHNNFTMWKKKYQEDHPTTAIAVVSPLLRTETMTYDPFQRTRNPEPARIKGQLYYVPTDTLHRLDEAMANGVYLERTLLKIEVPTYDIKNGDGQFHRAKYAEYVEAHTYLGNHDVIQQEPYYACKAVQSQFKSPQREHNLKRITSLPYYEFTRKEFENF